MNSNRMLTLALYLLLGGLVAVFGYRACQLKKEQAAKMAEQAEMEQTLRDMGYQDNAAENSGVAKPSDLSDTKTTTPAPSAATPAEPAAKSDDAATKAAEPKASLATEPAPKPVTSSTDSKITPTKRFVDRNESTVVAEKPTIKTTKAPTKSLTAKSVASKSAVAPAKASYAVVAASFSKKENARKVMEALVKKGFANAEVSSKGKYWVVISDRASTKEAAAKMVELVNKQPDCAKAYVYKKP